MTEDLINNKDIYFPSYLGTNDSLITLLNRASQTLSDWFSNAYNHGSARYFCHVQKPEGLKKNKSLRKGSPGLRV